MRISLAVAAMAMAGVGAMKTYGAYTAANMSDSDLLLAENVLAVCENGSGSSVTCYTHFGEYWKSRGGTKAPLCPTAGTKCSSNTGYKSFASSEGTCYR